MTATNEARIWRRMGDGFARVATGDKEAPDGFTCGICRASARLGLPAYNDQGARVRGGDYHGLYGDRFAAAHRALTCYLMAEMVLDECAPGGTDDD